MSKLTPAQDALRNQQILANTVNKLRMDRHRSWSRDQLLCHPDEAKDICISVRQALAFASNYDDYTILRTYLNFCKRSKLVSGIPGRGRKRGK
jgi:hypothetical protein